MARREVFIDDLNGVAFDEGEGRTVTIQVDDKSTTLDLTNDNILALEERLSPYFQPNGSTPKPTTTRQTLPTQGNSSNREAMQEIRKWAKKNGFKVSARGRIPYAVMDAYTKAHMLTRR